MTSTGRVHRPITEMQKLDILDLVYRINETSLSVQIKEHAEGAAIRALSHPPLQKREAKILISALVSLLTVTAKGATT